MKVYSVFDSKALFWAAPFILRTNGEAVRAFASAANDPTHSWGRFPTDFTLFHIGYFDHETGEIRPTEAKMSLAVAAELVGADATLPLFEEEVRGPNLMDPDSVIPEGIDPETGERKVAHNGQ